jgi:hypothetical protein
VNGGSSPSYIVGHGSWYGGPDVGASDLASIEVLLLGKYAADLRQMGTDEGGGGNGFNRHVGEYIEWKLRSGRG